MQTNLQACKTEKLQQYRYLKDIVIVFGIIGGYFLSKDALSHLFTNDQLLTLALLIFAVYLWTLAPIPTGISSFLVIGGMLALGLVSTVEEAVVGFLSSALYFILVLSLISKALAKVGMDNAVARLLIKLSKGGAHYIIIGLPIFIVLLPIFLPSAVARFQIFLPLVNRLNEYYGFGEKSIFKKYCMYVIGMLNQNATMIIFTGGGFSVLAYQLIQDFNVANLSWLGWFLRIGPPLWLAMVIVAVSVWFFLRMTTPKEDWLVKKDINLQLEDERNESIPPRFWVVTGTFLLMILTWIFTDHDRIPLVLPPMLLVVFYALPKLNLINNETLRKYDWENFLLLGSSFSLALLIETNGTAKVLASQLMRLIPGDANVLFNIFLIALLVFLLRFLFTLPSSAMVVIFPIAVSYAELMGVAPLGLAFLVVMIIGGMMVLPIHSPTTFYAYETGVFSKKEQYSIGALSSIVTLIVAVLAATFYW